MDPVTRARELGRRYLDGLLNPAEAAELERILQGSPDAADAFAGLSRLESDLAAHFGEEPERRREAEVLERIERDQHRRRWRSRVVRLALAAGLLLLVGGPLLWWLGERAELPPGGHDVLGGEVLVAGHPVERLADGDLLAVAGQGPALLRLSGGARARLEPETRVLLRGAAPGLAQWIDLLAGEGRFEVPDGEPLRIDTPAGRVTAADSDFTVQLTKPEEGEPQMRQSTLLSVVVLAGLAQVEVREETHFVAAGESRVFGAPEQRGRPGPTAARTLFGQVTEVKGTKLTVALGRRTLPALETFELGPKVKVLIDGKPGKAADLAKDMAVRLEMDDKDAVLAVLAEGPTMGATLKEVGDGKVTLLGRGPAFLIEKDTTYPVAPDARVSIGNKPARLSDLRVGARVMVKLSADRKSAVAILQPDAGREGLPMLAGQIQAVDAKAGTLTLAAGRAGEAQKLTLGKEVKVTILGRQAALSDLKTGVYALVRLAPDRTVLAITVSAARAPDVQGFQGRIVAVQGSKLTLQVGRRGPDSEQVLEVGKSIRVVLDGKPANVSDLAKGMIVRVVRDRDVVVRIVADPQVQTGRVKAVDGDRITLEGRGREDGPTFELTPDTKIALDGKEARAADLKPGTSVMLYLSADGKRLLAIRAGERTERATATIGVLKAVDAKAGTLTVEGLRGGQERTLTLAKEVKVTVAGKEARPEDLKSGQTVVLTLDRDGRTVREITVRGRP
jgi:hypothetical protein